jgi:protein phosphatase
VLTVHALTHPGSVRPTNEDAVLWDPELSLLVIADGMGGHNAGEVASRFAVDSIRAFFGTSPDDDGAWPFGFDSRETLDSNRLRTALKIANGRVFRSAGEHSDWIGMGTTVVAATLRGAELTFASVGDSRLYLFDGVELRQMTRDDSWVAQLRDGAGLDGESLSHHPMRHVLTSVVGTRPELEVAAEAIRLRDGHSVVLSSDGLHEFVRHDALASAVREAPGPEAAAERLLRAALSAGGGDNISVMVARFTAEPTRNADLTAG